MRMKRRTFLVGGALIAAGGVSAAGAFAQTLPGTAKTAPLHYVTRPDGCKIAYRDYGVRTPPGILFFTGAGTAMALWGGAADPISLKTRVVIHDRRGNGDSDPGAPETHTFETFVADALAVMDDAKMHRPILCGLAYGSRVAMRVAIAAPERASGLVLFDATGGAAPSGAQQRAGQEEAARLRAQAGLPNLPRDPDWFYNKHPEAKNLNGLAMKGAPPWLEEVKTIRLPTLVAVGEQDPNFDASHRLAKDIPGARIVTMPMTGHGSIIERPDLVLQHLETFLDEIRKAKT